MEFSGCGRRDKWRWRAVRGLMVLEMKNLQIHFDKDVE